MQNVPSLWVPVQCDEQKNNHIMIDKVDTVLDYTLIRI